MSAALSEEVSLIGYGAPIDDDALSTGWLHVGQFRRLMGVVAIGAAPAGAVNAKLEQADNADGDNPVDVIGKAITEIAQGAAAGKAVIINAHRDNSLADGKPYVRLSATVGGEGGPVFAALFGGEARHKPVSHAAGVVQEIK